MNLHVLKKSLTPALAAIAIAGSVFGSGVPVHAQDRIEMHRLYNRQTGEHFYTGNTTEKDGLVNGGWKYEGIGWIAPASGDPVYRLCNPHTGDHHYTLNPDEKNGLVKVGWRDEGIGWYSDPAKTIPMYRMYNRHAQVGSHHYTTSQNEVTGLVARGWKDENVGWYAVGYGTTVSSPDPTPTPGTQAPGGSTVTAPATPVSPAVEQYVVNINSGKFHHPWCVSVKRMNNSNKRYVSGTRSDMIRSGYSPCHNCDR